MKKFIIGLITGVMLASTIALAATYVAEPATFKVLVNGKEFNSDPPALVVEGRTYLPLRAIGDALGVPVEWNEELKQAEVGIKTTETEKTASEDEEQESMLLYYPDGYGVIDFGKYRLIECLDVEKQIEEDGFKTVYKYPISEVDAEDMSAYFYAVEQLGYKCIDKTSTLRGYMPMKDFTMKFFIVHYDELYLYVTVIN